MKAGPVLLSDFIHESARLGKQEGTRLCWFCNKEPATERDHFYPKSRGGKEKQGNLIPACRSCNARKKDALVFGFMRRLYASEKRP